MGAGIIVIGNEVLSGKVTDINSTWLMAQFHDLGMPVERVSIIPDDIAVIAEEVRRFSGQFDVVLTTGGVGPTHDDVTFAAIAQSFDKELVANAELEAIIREHIPAGSASGYLRMAKLPEGTHLLYNPGLPFPVTRVENVYVMPGEPTVLRKKFLAIRETFRQAPFVVNRAFLRVDEGEIAERLDRLQSKHPQVEIGSYPVYDNHNYKVQVTFEAKNEVWVESAFHEFLQEFRPEDIWKTE